ERFLGGECILGNVVQQAYGDGRLIEPHVREDEGHVQRMDEVGLARAPHLPAMLPRRENVGLLKQLLIEVGLVRLHFVEDVFESDHRNAASIAFAEMGKSSKGKGESSCAVDD